MTKPKAKAAGPSAEGWMSPHAMAAMAEDRLYRQLQAVLADAAKRRELSAAEVVGVLTAVTYDVLANVWAQSREQRRKAQAGKEKA